MGYVNQMAKEAKMIVIATIHQPSTDLFMTFSHAMFLATGRVAYHGPPSGVKAYCESIQKPLPDHTNPADHFISLINGEFVDHDEVEKVLAQWKDKPVDAADIKALPAVVRPGVVTGCMTLLGRHFRL